MKACEVKPGVKVLIDKYCHKTDRSCTLVPEMKQYLGTIQTIQGGGSTSTNSVGIKGYNWDRRDLSPVSDELTPMDKKHIPSKINPFDPNELDL